MKHRCLSLLTALLLLVSLAVPAAASTNIGAAYDVTEQVSEGLMEGLGNELFPQIQADYGIDLHLDIVDDLEDETIQDYAQIFYDQYEYGDPDTGDGVLLMVYVTPDIDGLYLNKFTLYADGQRGDELRTVGEFAGMAISHIWNDTTWGGDIDQDSYVLATGIDVLVQLLTDYFDGYLTLDELNTIGVYGMQSVYNMDDEFLALAEYAGDEIYDDESYDDSDSGSEDLDLSGMQFVMDYNDELTDDEEWELNNRLMEIAEEYGCGIYCATMYDFASEGYDDIERYGKDFYGNHGLGLGDDADGLLLLMDMSVRKYALIGHGDISTAAFTDYGKQQIANSFKPDFKNDMWFDGFMSFADECDYYLDQSGAGRPVDIIVDDDYDGDYDYDDYDSGIDWDNVKGSYGLAFIIGAIIAGIVVFIMKKRMVTAVEATEAAHYVPGGGVTITGRQDHYTHTTRTSRRIHDDSDHDSGDYGGTSCDSDGYSSDSGDF